MILSDEEGKVKTGDRGGLGRRDKKMESPLMQSADLVRTIHAGKVGRGVSHPRL